MLKERRGFALVWIAALLIVASLAVSMLLVKEDARSVWEPQLAAHQQLTDVEQALIKFQRTQHRLPCPAPRDQLPDSTNFGVESTNCHLGTAIAGTQRVDTGSGVYMRIGVLPVRTLGLNHNYHGDKWNNRLTYAVVERLTDPYQFSDTAGTLRLTNESGATILTNGAFAVVSHGADGKGAYTLKGGVLGKACTSAAGLDQENCNNDRVFTRRVFNTQQGADYYDDNIIVQPIDAQAQGMNTPCYTPRTLNPFTWTGTTGVHCSAPFTDKILHGATKSLSSTSGGTGNATVRCDNSTLVPTSATCN